jgi:BRCT domain type II-containing protein
MANKTKCVKDNTKKYKTRPSPPFPANKCKGKTKKGNNGKMFKSKPDANGVHKWVAVVSAGATKTKATKPKANKTTTKKRKSKKTKKTEPVSEKKSFFGLF